MKIVLLFLFLFLPWALFAEEHECPMHAAHQAGLDSRGDVGMGFDHMKSTHHFFIDEKGGTIEASAKDPVDTQTRDQIRAHFQKIAKMFAEGNFELPMFIHDTEPDGVAKMKLLKNEIRYEYQEQPAGAVVKIATDNAQALAAIHDFLTFQIREHRTGDPR
jgi:hypothetical protein